MLEFVSSTVPLWQAVAYALIAFFASMMVMNKGSWWIVNVMAQKEPALVSLGVFLTFYTTSQTAYVGLGLIGVGVIARYTGVINV